mmetsp:Transcript_29313/g.41268  ORF Transcript_29313/g.41268 Transcript_29313/m.41268 type:complete len:109 (-) Transcript_29313:23-349(-)
MEIPSFCGLAQCAGLLCCDNALRNERSDEGRVLLIRSRHPYCNVATNLLNGTDHQKGVKPAKRARAVPQQTRATNKASWGITCVTLKTALLPEDTSACKLVESTKFVQ